MLASGGKNSESDRAGSRRQQVLVAAADCFTRSGFHGASMAEVAKAANMSVGHIYHYFENKEAIIASIVEDGIKKVIAMMDGIRSEQDVLRAVLDQADRNLLEQPDCEHYMLGVEMVAEATRNPKVAAVIEQADSTVRAKLRELILATHHGILSPAELDGRVELAAALFDGLKLRAVRNPNFDREAMAPVLRAALQTIFE